MTLTEEQRGQVEANMGLIGKVLKDKLRVGGITNMYVIAQTMAEAGNVVKI